jgi:Flp pilus assembly protein TadB
MSKERARRREEREREAAIKTAARASEEERRERRAARKKALTGRFPRLSSGHQTGALAQRRRIKLSLLVAFLLALNVVLWVVRPDWPARLAGLVVSLLVAPLLAGLLLRRR